MTRTEPMAGASEAGSPKAGEGLNVVVFDYGAGNVHSALGALQRLGENATLSADEKTVAQADGLVVPGVGAFATVIDRLRAAGGVEMIRARVAAGKPVLGICVGMQVLFERSTEKGDHAGLGLFTGVVDRLPARRLPHMGWSKIQAGENSRLLAGIEDESFYFVHSYGVLGGAHSNNSGEDAAAGQPLATSGLGAGIESSPVCLSTAHHGADFLAAIESGPVFATQFHPEKSGAAGLQLLANWLGCVRQARA